MITLVLFAFYALFWVFFENRIEWLGYLIALCSIATVFATAMIYAQLKTVPSWNSNLTPVCYILFSLASGVLMAASFGFWKTSFLGSLPFLALVMLALAWGAKFLWWQSGETLASRGSSTGTATGLGKIGKVRLLEKPHSGENYLTKEMVHQVGRKHANKLRMITLLLGAIIPIVVCIIMLMAGGYAILFAIAFLSLIAGLFVERWLFFAEAEHAVSLYY